MSTDPKVSPDQQVQALLFERIREQLLPHQSLVDEVSDLLNIAVDGGYRRIRNATPLRFWEAVTLCEHYGLSLDELFLQQANAAIRFVPAGMGVSDQDFEQYLTNLLHLISHLQQQHLEQAYFSAKDIPIFHLFQFPELALFKMFFWRNTIFNDPNLAGKRFSPTPQNEQEERCLSLCHQIAAKYALIPTTEIWSEETARGLIKQIAYYHEAGLFARREDAIHMAELAERYFHHLKREAELGYKFLPGHEPQHRVENFHLYYNDLILLENLIWLGFEQNSQAFVVYHSIEYLRTDNALFADQVKSWLENLFRKSELISSVAERQRNRYFMKVFEQVDHLKASLNR